MFGLFAEIKRDLISERTKQALLVARQKGKLLGRPKESFGKSRLDGKDIKMLLGKKVPNLL
jgi:DNA invertase Pin-like site-specific DNA recombinase